MNRKKVSHRDLHRQCVEERLPHIKVFTSLFSACTFSLGGEEEEGKTEERGEEGRYKREGKQGDRGIGYVHRTIILGRMRDRK